MELATQVQILDKAVCISCCINVFGKVMNPSVLSTTDFIRQPVLEKEN